ncbi:metallophosphoesterase family protein [Paenibacillus gansuensis]|uniref:Phosphoesterase n=1 Tax=Paenibacillus gansuensis TaxID=306542 RepID=A0ABW5PAD5_9BACL
MRIGIVSDTHMSPKVARLPNALVEGLQGVELILHIGDWTSLHVAGMMEEIAPVDGVAGNNDGLEIRERFGRKKVLSIAGFRIGMVHGDGSRKTTEQRAWEAFEGEQVDVILFGHSHIPFMERRGEVLMFNPGSPSDKRRQPKYSYGILELEGTIRAQHYYYESKA